VFDAASLDNHDYLVDHETLVVAGNQVPLTAKTRGWIRRLAPPWWRASVTAGTRDAAIRSAHVALLFGLAADASAPQWLTALDRLLWADNKLFQMRIATRIGIPTPATAVASRPVDVPRRLGDRLVLKPLGAAHFSDGDDARVVYTQAVGRSDLGDLPLAGAPFLVQSFVPVRRHLRVVTVKDHCWVAGLDAGKLPVDWRADESAHHAFLPVDQPTVASAAVRLASQMELGYSSQDWIDAGDENYLIDVNPGGQWLFLPEQVSREVTDALAHWLAGTPPQ